MPGLKRKRSSSQKQPKLSDFSQYHFDLFTKLGFPFVAGKKMLDIGCGDGTDSQIFSKVYRLKVTASDLFKHKNFSSLKINFVKASVFKLPFKPNTFDYAFLHDVLHHVDEAEQSRTQHAAALAEALRVVKKGGYLIVLEGNRYNPMFYPHMVKMRGHQHFPQSYFNEITSRASSHVSHKYFEAHVYPRRLIPFFKIYERIMEQIVPAWFRAYNVAIIKK